MEDAAVPQLKGQQCGGCDRVHFPPNSYGCEKCGATDLADRTLIGRGRILAVVTTHHANQRDIAVPYTVASIRLDEGVVIRAVMAEATDDALATDDRVEAVVVNQALRFQKCELV